MAVKFKVYMRRRKKSDGTEIEERTRLNCLDQVMSCKKMGLLNKKKKNDAYLTTNLFI
jgi:hypothetical protein